MVGFALDSTRLVEALGDNSGVSDTFHDYTINLTRPAPTGGLKLSLASSLDGEVSFSAPVNTQAAYNASNNVFTVLQGQSSATLRVTAVNDTDIEGREVTDVTLSKAAGFEDDWGDIDTGNTQRRIRIEPNDRIVQFNTTQLSAQIVQNTDVELLLHINHNTADHALPVLIKADGAVVYHGLIPNTAAPGQHSVTFPYPSSTSTTATFTLEGATLRENGQTTHFPRNLGWRAVGRVQLFLPVLGDIRFASKSSRVVEGQPVDVDILINPPLPSNSRVFLRSSGDAVTITGSQYNQATKILTLNAGQNKVTVTVGTNADSEEEMDGSATLTLANVVSFPNTHGLSPTINTHEIKIVETRNIGFAAPTIDTTYKTTLNGQEAFVGHQPRRAHLRLNEPGTLTASTANITVSASDTDVWAALNLAQDVELTLTASAQGDPALGDRPDPQNPDNTSDYSVPATVTIDKSTGTGTFAFSVLQDNFPEAREVVEIRLADGNNNLPTGWEIGSQSSYWVVIYPNDNAIRFAEWPRGNPGSFAGLDVSIVEGETKYLLILMTNYAYNDPFEFNANNDYRLYMRSTTTNFRDELAFANGNPLESSWNDASAIWRIKAVPFRGVRDQNGILVPTTDGGGAVIAASLQITAKQDNIAEGSEVIELTLEEQFGIPSYWGSITNTPDTGSPSVDTSTTFRITITDN